MKVLYVSSKGGIHDFRFLEKLVNDFDILFLHYASDSIIDEIKSLKNLKIVSKKPIVKPFPILSELPHFKKIYKDFKPDIVHTGYIWQVGILASIINIHPHLSMVWGSDVLIDPDKNFILKAIVKKVLTQCDFIQCDAQMVKNKIISDYKIKSDKIFVFPWGIDLTLFKPLNKPECRNLLNLDENAFIILFTRPLEKIYDISSLLKGFLLFATDKTNVKLLITSDGSLKNELIKFIKINMLEDKIIYYGLKSNKEMPLYYNASDIYISTSLTDGTSLSLLEAMACKLGIIVTDIASNREWVLNDRGIIIPKSNYTAIKEGLNKYYYNRNLISIHGEICYNIAKQRANWDNNYLKLKEIYNKMLM